MNPLLQTLPAALALLAARHVPAALVGGLAVSTRVEPRFTRDIDLALAVADDLTAEAVVRDFLARGYRLLAMVEQDAAGRLATARLIAPYGGGAGPVVDLLFASSGVEPELVAGAETLAVFPEVLAPVAALGDLIALKVLARDDRARPQDRVDLQALLALAAPADLARTATLFALIAARGFDRGRDLPALLASARQELLAR